MLRSCLFSLVIVMVFTNTCLLGNKTIILRNKWQDINGNQVLFIDQFKDKDEISIIYFRSIDCSSCVIKALNIANKINSDNTIGIIGFIHDYEIELYLHLGNNFLILKDKNYKLYRQLKLRKMSPFLLKINKKRGIIKTLDYFELERIEK